MRTNSVKPTVKLTFCAIISALSTVIMLFGYIEVATYAVAAIAGLMFIIPAIEVGKLRALGCYIVTSLLALLFCEPYTKVIFVAFFGYYPILKSVYDKIHNIVLNVVLKLITFNAAAVAAYYFISRILNLLPFGSKHYSAIFIVIGGIAGNIVFLLYDYAINGVVNMYLQRLHFAIQKMLEGRRL